MALARTRKRTWIGLILVAAACVGFYTGHTPLNFLATGVGMNTFGTVDLQNFRLMVGQSIPFEACVSDKHGDMYLFLNTCSGAYPKLFHWTSAGTGRVRVEKQQLYAEKSGTFILYVRALGHTNRLVGEVLTPMTLTLSAYDTTLRVGDEMVLGSGVAASGKSLKQVNDVHFYLAGPSTSGAITWDHLTWAYPAGARVSARAPGVACLGLKGDWMGAWLRVTVVDSDSKKRQREEVDSARSTPCDNVRGDRGASQLLVQASPPTSALADSGIATGARKAFAFQVCVYRRRPRTPDEANGYRPDEDLEGCANSLAGVAPEWRFGEPRLLGGAEYAAELIRAGDPDHRRETAFALESIRNEVHVEERGGLTRTAVWLDTHLQGDEISAIWSAFGCAKMRTTPPASIDALIVAAKSAPPPASQSPIAHACDAPALTVRPRLPGDASDTRVDEGGRFKIRYSRSARGFTIVVNPVRWGETSVLSYRVDDTGRLLRTLENRDPTEMDEHLSSAARWEFGKGG